MLLGGLVVPLLLWNRLQLPAHGCMYSRPSMAPCGFSDVMCSPRAPTRVMQGQLRKGPCLQIG